MRTIMKSKKGGMLLRDFMFTVLIFGFIIVLASLFVNEMATEYGNDNLTSTYATFSGNTTQFYTDSFGAANDSFVTAGGEGTGTWGFLALVFSGIGTFLGLLINIPIFLGQFVAGALVALNMPVAISGYIKNTIAGLIYILIAFGIGTAISRGSKM
tara:strand:+ start:315 stop:782 length:468 start_codon:yes stop_codon:yes gene_type:complete